MKHPAQNVDYIQDDIRHKL